jgi:POT family proton-dependent oligopeptide transporter
MANAAANVLAGKLSALYPPGAHEVLQAKAAGIDLQPILNGQVATAGQIAKLKELEIPFSYSTFMGYTIHNLHEFFMLFVVMSGIAAFILFLLTGWLGKMMHGKR